MKYLPTKFKYLNKKLERNKKLKHSIKKNQIVITALALMIAVAGYINYSGNLQEVIAAKKANANVASNEYDILYDDITDEIDEQKIIEPGTAILTSSTVNNNIVAQAKLNREQVRAKNKETLLNIVNNEKLSENAKQNAVNQISELSNNSEREMAAEMLLEAKGFKDSVVSIVDGSCDVVVNCSSLTDVQKTQIEDIVKRKSNIPAEKISINVCNN